MLCLQRTQSCIAMETSQPSRITFSPLFISCTQEWCFLMKISQRAARRATPCARTKCVFFPKWRIFSFVCVDFFALFALHNKKNSFSSLPSHNEEKKEFIPRHNELVVHLWCFIDVIFKRHTIVLVNEIIADYKEGLSRRRNNLIIQFPFWLQIRLHCCFFRLIN